MLLIRYKQDADAPMPAFAPVTMHTPSHALIARALDSFLLHEDMDALCVHRKAQFGNDCAAIHKTALPTR